MSRWVFHYHDMIYTYYWHRTDSELHLDTGNLRIDAVLHEAMLSEFNGFQVKVYCECKENENDLGQMVLIYVSGGSTSLRIKTQPQERYRPARDLVHLAGLVFDINSENIIENAQWEWYQLPDQTTKLTCVVYCEDEDALTAEWVKDGF